MTKEERRLLHAIQKRDVKKVVSLSKKIKNKNAVFYNAIVCCIRSRNKYLLYYFLTLRNTPFNLTLFSLLCRRQSRQILELFYLFNSNSVHDEMRYNKSGNDVSWLFRCMKIYHMRIITVIEKLYDQFFKILPKTSKNIHFLFE